MTQGSATTALLDAAEEAELIVLGPGANRRLTEPSTTLATLSCVGPQHEEICAHGNVPRRRGSALQRRSSPPSVTAQG